MIFGVITPNFLFLLQLLSQTIEPQLCYNATDFQKKKKINKTETLTRRKPLRWRSLGGEITSAIRGLP